jgi:iron complex outermembrane receptor protein
MRFNGRKRNGAMALAAAMGLCGSALAGEPFIDPRLAPRHFGQVVPDLIPFDSALTGKSSFLYRREAVSGYEPGWAKVASAPKPFAAMAGVSEASTVVLATRLQAAGEGWAAGAAIRNEDSHSYKDGNGSTVDAGFRRESEWLGGRGKSAGGTMITLGAVRDVWDNGKLPNYTLDVDYLDQGGMRLTAENLQLPGWFNQAGGLVAWGFAHVDADNFTLRAPVANGMLINAVGDHESWRAQAWAAHDTGTSRTGFGVEGMHQYHSAKRYNRESGPSTISSYWLPGVTIDRASTWVEQSASLGETKVQGALRYDLVAMSAADVHDTPSTTAFANVFNYSPQTLYNRTYGGNRDNDSLDHNVSARLRAERPLTAGATGFVDLARLVRSPDYAERYSGNSGPQTLGDVGDPELEPEKHNRLSLGGSASGGGYKGYGQASPAGAWQFEATVWHDYVEDFVTTDTAHYQPGINTSALNYLGIVYRNVDARISGISADLQHMVGDHVAVRLNLVGQRGRNTTDHRALHQMAPFEANMFIDTFGGDEAFGWNAGARLRAVAAKKSVDYDRTAGDGQDVGGPAGAFATLDLYGGVRFNDTVAVTAGIDNVFDKLYREHLKPVPQTSAIAMPNAPGRTYLLRALVSF